MNSDSPQTPPPATPDYRPIPVEAAKKIAEEYGRQVVLLVGWDEASNRTHVTTYGQRAQDKLWAARGGSLITKALCIDKEPGQTYEDFRNRTAAAWAVERERLLDELEAAAEWIGRALPSLGDDTDGGHALLASMQRLVADAKGGAA